MVHQHFMLVDNFTVTQNIVLGSEVCGAGGILDMKKAREKVCQIIEQYGLEVDPDAKIVGHLGRHAAARRDLESALPRRRHPEPDEPTAVLTPQEIDRLIQIMRDLTAAGKTIIVITHKLKEIKASSNTCTIIRRGQYVDEVTVADVTEEDLADMMVGHHVNLQVEKRPATPGKTVFEIRGLHVNDERGIETVKGLDLTVRSGEIVGIAGIDGNGQKELVEAITCLTKATSGRILVNGEENPKHHAAQRDRPQGLDHPRGPSEARSGAALHRCRERRAREVPHARIRQARHARQCQDARIHRAAHRRL